MQQVSAGSGLQGSQAQGSVSSQSTRSFGEPPHSIRTGASRPKKRARSDSTCDPVKQQRTDKGSRCGEEKHSTWKPEALVGEDGGISSVASVDRLVCIMQYEWNDSAERQLDLIASRTMLAKVVATTSDRDCLVKFLRLGGLAILDRWLQEAHRGRHFPSKEIPADGEKALEDLLLALLGALEKLPVDLVTLKTWLVGKSVNLLRNHKHSDIQRRSKKLVEVWKKRVDSEMKEAGEGRLLVDPALCMQQLEGGMMASKMQQACYPENPLLRDADSGVGRGKFASVASLCSSQEGLPKTPSSLVSFTSVAEGSDGLANKGAPTAHVPASGVLSKSPMRIPSLLSPSSEDGKAKSSVNVASNVACAHVTSNQVRGVKGTGASRSRRSASGSNNKTSATAFSGSVIASKDSSASGSKEMNGAAAHAVVADPSCSSSQQNPHSSPMYDGSTRSSMNSASSCATDKRSTIQPCLSAEPVKVGIQLLANVAASESSMIDVKGPDSPSNRSVSMQRAMPILADNSILPELNRKFCNQFLLKTACRPQEGEHCDQISSTVSSPSETSAHVDICMYESKRAPVGYANSPSPHYFASETCLPSSVVRGINSISGVVASAQQVDEGGRIQVVNENINRGFLPPVQIAETVGESSVYDRTENRCIISGSPQGVLEKSILKGGLQGRSAPVKQYMFDPLESARQVPVEIQQELINSQAGPSGRWAAHERNGSPIPERSVDSKLEDPSLKTSSDSEVVVPSKGDFNQRPDFDLNEVLSSEEGAIQAYAISPNVGIMPAQNGYVSASATKSILPCAPMAPIAVVAAAKGPFILPSASYRPKGDLGWKGSAATSAFRPTQPRHSLQKANLKVPEQGMNLKAVRDFDLNVAADPISIEHGEGSSTSSAAATFSYGPAASAANTGSTVFFQRSNGLGGAALDLNQVDGGGEPQGRRDFDLNCGPMLQDSDEVALAGKHHGMRAPLISDNAYSGALSKLPSHPLNSVTPIIMPAFAMHNSEFSYPVGASPRFNSGPHDGLLQYNLVMQNQPGMACPPPMPSMPTGPYGGLPFGFSPASMQGFSAPFVDALRGPHMGASAPSTSSANGEQPMLSLQSKTPSYMMGMLADTIHQHQSNGGFWSRANLDLNAGPDGFDAKNVKDDRRHVLIFNEQMRARHQVMDMAAALQQREHEGCLSEPDSVPGPALKQQPLWR